MITVCHHLASLVMPIGDPQDIFFYPTLTLMMDSYNLNLPMAQTGTRKQRRHVTYVFLFCIFTGTTFNRTTKHASKAVFQENLITSNGVAGTLKKLPTSKGDYWIKQWFFSIASLFKMGTSLTGKNLLPEGANSFLYEQLLIIWKISFITLRHLP